MYRFSTNHTYAIQEEEKKHKEKVAVRKKLAKHGNKWHDQSRDENLSAISYAPRQPKNFWTWTWYIYINSKPMI